MINLHPATNKRPEIPPLPELNKFNNQRTNLEFQDSYRDMMHPSLLMSGFGGLDVTLLSVQRPFCNSGF